MTRDKTCGKKGKTETISCGIFSAPEIYKKRSALSKKRQFFGQYVFSGQSATTLYSKSWNEFTGPPHTTSWGHPHVMSWGHSFMMFCALEHLFWTKYDQKHQVSYSYSCSWWIWYETGSLGYKRAGTMKASNKYIIQNLQIDIQRHSEAICWNVLRYVS